MDHLHNELPAKCHSNAMLLLVPPVDPCLHRQDPIAVGVLSRSGVVGGDSERRYARFGDDARSGPCRRLLYTFLHILQSLEELGEAREEVRSLRGKGERALGEGAHGRALGHFGGAQSLGRLGTNLQLLQCCLVQRHQCPSKLYLACCSGVRGVLIELARNPCQCCPRLLPALPCQARPRLLQSLRGGLRLHRRSTLPHGRRHRPLPQRRPMPAGQQWQGREGHPQR
mmetsp:Transcript_76321/g.169084  ORF Transcript_76321/g.169084 Transcript_76321/m.169084 type:complete len:227 (-) Transcript_76321:108-788(-)